MRLRFNLIAALTVTALTVIGGSVAIAQSSSERRNGNIKVTRMEQDYYQITNSEAVILTQYCHRYARNENAMIANMGQNKYTLLFSSGAQCKVVAISHPKQKQGGSLDDMVAFVLGAIQASKGSSNSGATPMEKRQ